MRALGGQALRFVAAGGVNAVVSYAIYLALLQWVAYGFAYTGAYLAGIVISYVLNAKFVFHTPMSIRSALRFPLVYVFQYFAGLALLAALVELLHVPDWIAPWIVTFLLVPATFLLTRRALRPAGADGPGESR